LGGRCETPEHLKATIGDLSVEVGRGAEQFLSAGSTMASGVASYRGAPCTIAGVDDWAGPGLKFDVLLRANRWRKTPTTVGPYLPLKIDDHLWARCPPWRGRAVRKYLTPLRLEAFHQLFDRIGELGPEDQPPVSMVQIRNSALAIFAPAELTEASQIVTLANAAADLARSLSMD
ncbi:MAG: hypothetical protein OES13_08165, partial [Acidimicrobiia bacterium]|nr:hypothetical protein [Acidimicrobiia bacterium]